jgi:hypothetical protein
MSSRQIPQANRSSARVTGASVNVLMAKAISPFAWQKSNKRVVYVFDA